MIATNLLAALRGMGQQSPTGMGDPFGATPRRLPPVVAPAPPPEINPAAMRGIFDSINQGGDSAGSLARLPAPDLAIPAAAAAPQKHHGIFGRIGDFINSDEGKAILLRSGAKTITDGLGAGIAEGAY